MGFSDLYGGRFLRTTLAVATTGVAAGALTGAVGLGIADTAKPHDTPAAGQRATTVKHHRHATRPTPQMTFAFTHRPTPTPTPTKASPTATATATTAVSSAPAAPASAPPSTAPSSAQSSSGADSTAAPQAQPTG